MQHQIFVKLLQVCCLSAAIQGGDRLSIRTLAQTAPATVIPTVPPATTLAPTLKILAPTPQSILDIAATTVVVQYPVGSTIELSVNDKLVDRLAIGRTETDSKTNLIIQTWYGVSLAPGRNTIVAKTSQGEIATAIVRVTGVPTQLQLNPVETRVPADGRSLVTISGQLLDENHHPSKQDSIATLYTSAGEFAGVDLNPDLPGFQLPIFNGQFTAKLRASLDAQLVRIRATNLNLEAFTQVQFETNLRSAIATGVIDVRLGARGTDYYRSLSEFLPVEGNNNTQLQARGQVFATGRVGDWSVTGAFNSDRALNKVCDNSDLLFRDTTSWQTCEGLYAVSGDTSKVEVLTPSRDSVFVKLESSTGGRGNVPNLVMWGDYTTTELATRSQQFTATNRNLHGAKFNYNAGDLLVSGFYGDNVQGFQRDNIAPDGTSGTYFLSQRLLLSGSENLTIETEELNRSGTVIKVESLTRSLDYDLDYTRGTVLLRRPLLRTAIAEDGTILVRRLVATYQYNNGTNSNIYGGRAQYTLDRTTSRQSWIGASWLQENLGVRSFSSVGADGLIALGPNSNLIAEYARSTNNTGSSQVTGSAVRVEGQFKFSDRTSGRTYFRTTETGFANNATTSFVPGQTRYGADLSTKLGDRTTLKVQVDREENRGTAQFVNSNLTSLLTSTTSATGLVDNDLSTITAGIQQRIGVTTIDLDYVNRNRQDRLATDPTQTNVSSNQIRSRMSWPLTNNLALRAQTEINLSNQQDVVYPNRSAIGIGWTVYPGIELGISQNHISSTQYGEIDYTSFDFASSYSLTPSTKVTGSYSLSPYQSIGAVGLKQGFILGPGLKLDLNYERVIGNTAVVTGSGQQFAQSYSLGQTAASLSTTTGDSYGIGINYTDNPNFKANARYEYRNSTTLASSNLTAGVTGKLTPELTALLSYQQSSAANQILQAAGLGDTINFKVGTAFRNPASDEFNALLSYQYRRNPSVLATSLLTSIGTGSEDHTLALEGIYAPNWQWEFAGKYALRNATSYFDQSFSAGETIGLTQLKATYRIGYDWDLTGDIRWINQFATGRNEIGAALEAGYYVTPDLRLSGGYSLGVSSDPTVSRSAQGFYLGLTVKVNELFGGFGRQQATPAQQQESQVTGVTPPVPNPTPAAPR
jgi:hypothetical protein